jgi:hypothetical protein
MELSESTIIKKMNSSKCNFDISVDALIVLKKNKVPSALIDEMIKIQEKNDMSPMSMSNKTNSNDPNQMHDFGMYLFNNDKKNLKKVDAIQIGSIKTGGLGEVLANRYTAGIASIKSKAILNGISSKLEIESDQPIFFLYFQKSKTGKDGINYNYVDQFYMSSEEFYFTQPSTPNQFSLIKLRQRERENTREFVTSAQNSYSSKIGTLSSDIIQFYYDQIENGIYKVYFKEPLEDGEYCFIYSGETPFSSFTNDVNKTKFQMKVFDFSIYNHNIKKINDQQE